MGKKLLEKAGLIGLPRTPATTPSTTPGATPATAPGLAPSAATALSVSDRSGSEAARPKTAPGTMLGFMTAQSAAIQEAEQLRARLGEFEGALPARRLDATIVSASRWANRHSRSYDDPAFAELKADIAASGGNVQAIKVRPISRPTQGVGQSNPLPAGHAFSAGSAGSAVSAGASTQPQFEIVFGHRRHRACLELGLPVLALIEDLSEQQLFVEMERENRARKDLSAWEQGAMYARALDQGLYPSNRQLALAIGRDLGDIGKALSLARLPQAVVDSFASPLDLQFRWAKPLSDAQQQDPDGLLERARKLQAKPHALAPRQVLDALLATGATGGAGQGVGQSNPQGKFTIERDGVALAVLQADGHGRITIKLKLALDDGRQKKLQQLLESFLRR